MADHLMGLIIGCELIYDKKLSDEIIAELKQQRDRNIDIIFGMDIGNAAFGAADELLRKSSWFRDHLSHTRYGRYILAAIFEISAQRVVDYLDNIH